MPSNVLAPSSDMQGRKSTKAIYSRLKPENPWFLAFLLFGLTVGTLIIASLVRTTYCKEGGDNTTTTSLHLDTILYYATSRNVPQQTLGEIKLSFNVLKSIAPCNFLVFGLGRDSVMWASFNPRGKTLFLEEDPQWVQTVLKDAPELHVNTVRYRTHLSEAEALLQHYVAEPDCSPGQSSLRDNDKCMLALNMLAEEVYDTEWDMIMVDAPRGYFPEAPGRMAAIYSAAIMARNRKKRSGGTHVFLHDVNREVEKTYAEKFLCNKYLVEAEGRLWHFLIPPNANVSTIDFC